jgi:hypothetical protein
MVDCCPRAATVSIAPESVFLGAAILPEAGGEGASEILDAKAIE